MKGRCTCENGFDFDHDTGSCTSGMAGKAFLWLVAIAVIAVLIGVAGGVVGCCSCFGRCR